MSGSKPPHPPTPYAGVMLTSMAMIAGLISIIVVGSVMVLALFGHAIPDVLSNWGGIILGFYFGTFINLIRDYMGLPSKSGDEGSQ